MTIRRGTDLPQKEGGIMEKSQNQFAIERTEILLSELKRVGDDGDVAKTKHLITQFVQHMTDSPALVEDWLVKVINAAYKAAAAGKQ